MKKWSAYYVNTMNPSLCTAGKARREIDFYEKTIAAKHNGHLHDLFIYGL